MADTHGNRSRVSPSPPANSRRWLSRRERQEIRRAVNDFRGDDDVYSVSRHGTTVVLVRYRSQQHRSPAPTQQSVGSQQRQGAVQAQGNPTQAGSRQQRRAERSALRAKKWHAAQALQRSTIAAMQQQQPGNQALLQPQQEAAPTSTKRSCSANATPTKEGSSEEAGGMEAPSATSSTAHVRARAQRARMHSPGGGPATGQLLCSSAAFAGGGPPQPSAAFAGGLMQRFNAGMPACNSFTASGTPGPSMLEHMRAHEYPNFMRHHMQQGMSQQAAHARWGEYERFRMAGAQVSGS